MLQIAASVITALTLLQNDVTTIIFNSRFLSDFNYITPEMAWQFYIAIFTVKLAYLFRSWVNYQKISGIDHTLAGSQWLSFLQHHQEKLSINRKITIGISEKINTAMTFGYFKPIILIPLAYINGLPVASVEMIILHELAHIKHHDFVKNIFLLAAEQIYCFNPFVYLMAKRWRYYGELCCDAKVMSLNYSEPDYAQTLYDCSRLYSHQLSPAITLLGNNHELLYRIQSLSGSIHHPTKKYSGAVLGLTMIFLLCLPLLNSKREKESLELMKAPSTVLHKKSAIPTQKNSPLISIPTTIEVKKESILSSSEKSIDNHQRPHNFSESLQKDEMITLGNLTPPHTLHLSNLANNTILETKQILIREDDPAAGVSVVKIYKLVNKGGIWTATLSGIILEKTDQKTIEAQ